MNLLSIIKKELNILGIKPKKSLGQNFLVNKNVYQKIITALEIKKGDKIIEIGPGLGALTAFLAKSEAEIIAIEKDRRLINFLKNKFVNQKNVTIIEDDVLKFNPKSYKLKAKSYKLVGNIPYYLTSHLLRLILEEWPYPKIVVLTLQKEVAQRIVAKPPNMSLLAVSVQYYSRPEIIDYIPRRSFYPTPDVDSAIIKLVPREQFATYQENTKNFFRIVRAGFSGKRKQLINSLARGLKIKKDTLESKLKTASVDPHRRAETLTLEEWQKIANILSSPS